MSRILRSMTYRLIHSKLFYLIVLFLIIGEIGLFYSGGDNTASSKNFRNHYTYSLHDDDEEEELKVYAEYEKEDPLLANKLTQSVYNGTFPFVPGKTYLYQTSGLNVATVSYKLAMALIIIFVADMIFIVTFFGESFSDGAVRNMIVIKTRKECIYLSSLIINTIVCILMTALVFAALAICIIASGFYPIIYAKAFVPAVLVGLLVVIVLSSLMIFVLFIVQNPLLTFIFCFLLSLVSVMSFAMEIMGPAYMKQYKTDEEKVMTFITGGYEEIGNKEWYLPVDDFNIGRVYVPEDNRTIEFTSNTPNENYPGKTVSIISRTLYRANLSYYPFELMMYLIYPMYRDGLITRYALVSCGYLILLMTGGSYVIRKRNLN